MEHKKAKWSGDASGLNEKTLSLLFDYQRFEHEPELEALLDETENEYCAELSDDDLVQVSAAGEMGTARYESDGRKRSAVHGVFRKGPGLCVRQGRKPARRGGSCQRRFSEGV